jgi:hypothetical protein
MAKATNPTTFSTAFGVAPSRLAASGVLDVTLAIDTPLFIDPMRLKTSKHIEIRKDAQANFNDHFMQIIALLRGCKREGDPAWTAALRLMQFPEVKGTCLGYGAGSIDGRGFTGRLSLRALRVAREIVQIGIEDPDLFPALALFEPDIGPDRISDMVTNITYSALGAFNERVLNDLGLVGKEFLYGRQTGIFVENPHEPGGVPVILIPADIVRELPIAKDWDEIADSAEHNDNLRTEVNQHIGELWAAKTKRDKGRLKAQVLSGEKAFGTLLKAIRSADGAPYDVESDPEGILKWAAVADSFAKKFPLALSMAAARTVGELSKIVGSIVAQFRHLIEHGGLNKELYKENGKPRHERTAQNLFFAVAYAYCKANNVDVSPEVDTGNGKIDFKFSDGFNARVLVEIKLSTNSSTVSGYTTQLEIYKTSQQTTRAFYVVVDVGGMGTKEERLIKARNDASKRKEPLSELEFIDATRKPTASKRKKP